MQTPLYKTYMGDIMSNHPLSGKAYIINYLLTKISHIKGHLNYIVRHRMVSLLCRLIEHEMLCKPVSYVYPEWCSYGAGVYNNEHSIHEYIHTVVWDTEWCPIVQVH